MLFIRKRFSQGRPDGSMLIELVVATAVIAIALFALIMSTPMQLRSIKRAGNTVIMAQIAQSRIDYLRGKDFSFYDSASYSQLVRLTDNDKVVTKLFTVKTDIYAFYENPATYQRTPSPPAYVYSGADLVGQTGKIVCVKVIDQSDLVVPQKSVQVETVITAK
jgi:hypothetical protein